MDQYKNLRFTYGNSDQPHTLTAIGNGLRETTTFQWDANGNMTEASSISRPKRVYYSLEWDEENRLRLADMPKALQCAYYQYDASGFQTFIYGKMGEVTENNRTFVLPNESQPYSFKMKYSYDSWNRMQDITYPDGEVVHYKYNTGGMLLQVQGQRSYYSGLDSVIIEPLDPLGPRGDEYDDPTADNAPDFDTTGMGDRATYHNYLYNYITDIRYNEFELKSGQWYGNGTHAHYAYDILQRLSHLTAYNSANNAMQDISYTYDKASNITQISNAAGVVNTLGDTYSYSYTYDSLYRLTSSYGNVGREKPIAYYNLNMQYEADGRITKKNQSGTTRLNGTVQAFNDSRIYTYNTSQPHTVRNINVTRYQWDANGNMTNDGGTILTWDEENRLKGVSKSALGVCFLYDASGERFYKNSGPKQMMLVNGRYYMNLPLYDDPVLYTSPYLVATPDGYTKHYYVESERFASRIGDGTITSLNTHATTASALAAKQAKVNDAAPDSVQPNKLSNLLSLPFNWSAHHTTYWQHPDHLGSAAWVTDTNGTAWQHLQYMPWGEPFVDLRNENDGYETRYTFSGKERDEETGFSYFGARHYNASLSIWLSVDPMADKYPSTSPYTYCANNPVKLVDPNGEEIDGPDDPPKNIFQKGWAAFKRFDNYLLSGHNDGANRGTITERDKAVGGGAIAIIVTGGVALETGTIAAALSSAPSIANSIDDMTTDASGQTVAQRAAGDNSTAKGFVNLTKAVSSFVSAGSSTMTLIDKGIEKAGVYAIDMANGAYNGIKSTITAVKDFLSGNDDKDKNTKKH